MKKIKSLILLLVVASMLLSVVSCSGRDATVDAGGGYYGGDLTSSAPKAEGDTSDSGESNESDQTT